MRRWESLLFLLLISTVVLPARSVAQASEEAVKAAFLPRFARYVTWPAATIARSPAIQLCVIGTDPFGALLDQAVTGQMVDGKPFVMRRMSSPERAQGCHVAFIQGGVSTGQMLAALRPSAVLTVTDARHGPQRGIIHFVVANGRVRFFIDETEAASKGLGISARLLALALGVRQVGR
jgi:hypothetical protein